MSVHYKFKAALDFSTVTFDGIHISVSDLKREITEQKRLAKNADFDLQIQNAQTKEIYEDENTLIPKNTSVIVSRVPLSEKKKSQPSGPPGRLGNQPKSSSSSLPPSAVAKNVDLASMDVSEDEKIKAMISQSTADFDPSKYVKVRGQNQHGRVPESYRCFKCQQPGHWINQCPMKQDVDVKKSTGIPRSFMVVVEGPEVPGALITPEGNYAVPAIDHETYSGKNKPQVEPPPKPKIPDELLCPLCNDLLTDALMVPCCANSYCDECIRTALLESAESECPGCHEKETSPNDLIPNRFLRTTVNAFKNETGYSKPVKIPEKKEKDSPHKQAQAAAAEQRKLSVTLDELPDDLFPHSPRKLEPEVAEEQSDTTKDLYDFNDGSIPSPFAKSEVEEPAVRALEMEPRKHESGSRHPPHPPPPHHHHHNYHRHGGPPPPHHHRDRDFGRGPSNYNRGSNSSNNSPYSGGPPPPHHHHGGGGGGPPYHSPPEPPPPGFEVPPPGEERAPLIAAPPPPSHLREGDAFVDPLLQNSGGPPPQTNLPGSFNPMQPPPGFHAHPPPADIHQRPPMAPHPPGQYSQPNYPHNFPPNRPPPSHHGPPPMYNQGPGHGHYQGDGRRDDYGRGRGPPRRPFRDNRYGRIPEDTRPGAIEDPLKEFERIMKEKDRQKQLRNSKLRRSKSRSPGVSPRRTPSPYRKHSLSPGYPRSPSPKRKRIAPSQRYSRSRSRTPPPPPPPSAHGHRRNQRSRSRSRERERNRSISPHSRRRSPRRAPPYSPTPSSRFPKKEKDEYYEHHSRYDDRDRHGRFPSNRHHHVPAKDFDLKYEDDYNNKYSQEKYSTPPRHDGGGGGGHHGGGRYDYKSSSKSHQSHRHAPDFANFSEKDENKQQHLPAPQDNPRRRSYDEYEPTLVPPGTEDSSSSTTTTNIQPLLQIKIDPPPVEYEEYNSSSRTAKEDSKQQHEMSELRKMSSSAEEKEAKRRKSSEEKRLSRKEKKKHKKEKREEKKKEKKRKKSKDEPPAITDTVPLELPQFPTETDAIEKALENKLTAPCDSTVKSPERLDRNKESAGVVELPLKSVGESDKLDSSGHPVQQHDTTLSQHEDVLQLDVSCKDLSGLADPDEEEKEEEEKPYVPIPASKWDEFDENESAAPALSQPEPEEGKSKESKIPPEVLRRAEHIIFDKPKPSSNTVHTISVSVTELDNTKKFTLTDIGTLPEIRKTSDRSSDEDKGPSKAGSLSSTVFRKSVKDRLGSKVTDEESTRYKEKSSSSSSRDFSYDRQRTVPSRADKEDHLVDRGRKDRSRERYSKRRSRSRSRSPPRRAGTGRSRSPRNLRLESRGLDRSRERASGRSGSRNRDKSNIRHSPLLSRAAGRNRSPDRKPPEVIASRLHPHAPPAREDSSSRRRREREHSPPKDFHKSRSSDKGPDGVSGVAAAFTNLYGDLNAKKSKRINIKLSSSSRAEKDSGSSSSEEHEENLSASLPQQQRRTSASNEPEVESKKKKQKKRRKSSSSSSSSSSSDEKYKKRSKKSKKKKKKKKKSK